MESWKIRKRRLNANGSDESELKKLGNEIEALESTRQKNESLKMECLTKIEGGMHSQKELFKSGREIMLEQVADDLLDELKNYIKGEGSNKENRQIIEDLLLGMDTRLQSKAKKNS